MRHTKDVVRHLHLDKPGIRGLGIAESYTPDSPVSILAGVVMRNDRIIDGFAFGRTTVYGQDATAAVDSLASSLHRDDISYIMVWGTIISGYNMVDTASLYDTQGVPVLGLSAQARGDAGATISERFPDRTDMYRALGAQYPITLQSGSIVYTRISGCTITEAESLLNATTQQGRIPEPVRVARILAGAARLSFGGGPAPVDV